MIKGKVSNVSAQKSGTELYVAQAAKYTDELASVVKNNYPPTEYCLGLLILKGLKESNCFKNKVLENYQKTIAYRILIGRGKKRYFNQPEKIHNYKKRNKKEVGICV